MKPPKKFVPIARIRDELLWRIKQEKLTYKQQIDLMRKVIKAITYQELEKIEKELK